MRVCSSQDMAGGGGLWKKDTSVANFGFEVMELEISQDTIETYVLAI